MRSRARACVATLAGVAAAVTVSTGPGMVTGNASTLTVSAKRLTAQTNPSTVPATTCRLGASADSYVSQGAIGSNFGSHTALAVRSEHTLNKRLLVRFDVSACAIPTGSAVQSASLQLTITAGPTIARTYGAHRATSSWTESGVTWATQPSFAGAATATAPIGTSGGAITWDVKSDVAAFVAGTSANEGWTVRDGTEGELFGIETSFGSREQASPDGRPTLSITYYP